MDKSKKTPDLWQRQGIGRRAFHRTQKQDKNRKSGKSEKLKELTELLKNKITYQPYPNQHSLLLQKKHRPTTSSVNFEEPEKAQFLSPFQHSHNQDDCNQCSLNEFQTKLSNLKISFLEEPNNIMCKSITNLTPLITLNTRILTELSHKEYRLLAASQKDTLFRSASFSQIESFSCKYTANLRNFQDQLHRACITTKFTANSPTKIFSKLGACENNTRENICFVHLQYKKENNETYYNTNSEKPMEALSLRDHENRKQNDLIPKKNKQLPIPIIVNDLLKTVTYRMLTMNKEKVFESKSIKTTSTPTVPVTVHESQDRNLKRFLLGNEISSYRNIKFENISETVPSCSISQHHPILEIKQTEGEIKEGFSDYHDSSSNPESVCDTIETNEGLINSNLDVGSKNCLSSNLSTNCFSSKDKIKTDKSKRRKGMYIESTDWTESSLAHKKKLEQPKVSIDNLNEDNSHQINECHSVSYLNSLEKDGVYTRSTNSLDLSSLDSDFDKTAKWTNQSFSFQSSKQKDEYTLGNGRHKIPVLSNSNISSVIGPHDIKIYMNRSLFDQTKKLKQENLLTDGEMNAPNSQLMTQTKAASTPSKIDHIGASDISKSNYPYKLNTLDNLTSFDKKSYLELERAVSEEIFGQIKCCTQHLIPSPNKNEIHQVQSNRILSEPSIIKKPRGQNICQQDLFSTSELLVQLLHGSEEKLVSEQRRHIFTDTRTHIAEEIYRNEQSYVESLQMVVLKYFNVLKSPEYAGMIESKTVDEIFFMVPDILAIHEEFLKELKKRLDTWVPDQKVGDAFVEIFSKTEVLEVYTSFVNNCNRAKNAIRTAKQSRPSFARFLETTAREHKGKLTLDNLLIKPVQKFPNYEMLFTRLIKHTIGDHPDQKHLQEVLKLVHDILVHINCKEKEILENFQREATLRELENVIEGITDLNSPDRQFIIFDLVHMPTAQGTKKERGFFLFNDFLLITSVKRKSGTIRKPNTSSCPSIIAVTLDSTKYKFLTKVSLENLENIKSKEEAFRKESHEFEQLADDCNKLQHIAEMAATINYPHQMLEEAIRDIHLEVQSQLSERQLNENRLNMLDITINSPNGSQHLEVIFSSAEKRCQWEEAFDEAKQKLAATLERHPIPEFVTSIPIVKTRAGLQFTCAEPTLREPKEVWVCNSDGYVGQVCVMSLFPEPNVTSCNGVCNARILCLASAPASGESKKKKYWTSSNEDSSSSEFKMASSLNFTGEQSKRLTSNATSFIKLDSNSSSDDSEQEGALQGERIAENVGSKAVNCLKNQSSYSDEVDGNQSTMWLGTEDGYIHVYNCTDTIRIKKNKIKIQHASAVYAIMHLENRIFVSLANGDLCVYHRESVHWNTTSPLFISIGTVSSPVTKLLTVYGKLWCSIQGIIKVLDTETLQVVHQIQVSSDSKPITNMALSCNTVWISVQNSANLKCFHANTYQIVTEVNLGPAVNKMLSSCDEIIRQHKAACLRVTSLLSCKDLIWIGTSAGVLLTIAAQGLENGPVNIVPSGIPYGHTGHVRFLTFVETSPNHNNASKFKDTNLMTYNSNQRSPRPRKSKTKSTDTLVISGGDGFEDFRNSGANSLSEIAGREDSTNHLLVWQI